MSEIQEKKEYCSKAFISWFSSEKAGTDMSKHNEEIAGIFTSRMILKKFEVFDIDIVLPDALLLILAICTNGNPGQFQIILKDLLNSIVRFKGKLPAGYVITVDDFTNCFMMSFPIIDIPSINDKYRKLWDEQKKTKSSSMDSDNKCDTPEWWKEVMR